MVADYALGRFSMMGPVCIKDLIIAFPKSRRRKGQLQTRQRKQKANNKEGESRASSKSQVIHLEQPEGQQGWLEDSSCKHQHDIIVPPCTSSISAPIDALIPWVLIDLLAEPVCLRLADQSMEARKSALTASQNIKRMFPDLNGTKWH